MSDKAISIVFSSAISATFIATVLTWNPLVFVGGIIGTIIVVKILVHGQH